MSQNKTISSDDPKAVEKLQAQLDELRKFQAEMKSANAHYRKHKTMRGHSGLDNETAAQLDQKIKDSFSWQQQPYPSFKLQNNNANIRRIEKRIKELENKSTISAQDGWEFDGGSVEMNLECNRIQIFFDAKPDEEVRRELKSRGFKWAPSTGAWQRQLNGNGLYAVRQLQCVQANLTKDGSDICDHNV